MGKRELEQRRSEKDLQRLMALRISESYCAEQGLSFDKLKNQMFDFFNGAAWFLQPSGVTPKGLTNDKETMPKPTLIIRNVNGNIVIEQTENTQKYLS